MGPLPATPIMRWLAERGGPIERFSQAMLLTVPAALDGRITWLAALQALLDHHDALRLRLDVAAPVRRALPAPNVAPSRTSLTASSPCALAADGGAAGHDLGRGLPAPGGYRVGSMRRPARP